MNYKQSDKKEKLDDLENSVNKKDINIEFDIYDIYLYSRNGNFICNTHINDSNKKEENKIIDNLDEISDNTYYKNKKSFKETIITNLIKKICVLDFEKHKKNEGIHYNSFNLRSSKILSVNIPVTNLVAIGIFSKSTKSDIIRLFLLNLIISYINYQGDKTEYFHSKNYMSIDNINKMNYSNFNNFMHSKIYDTFLSIPLEIHFGKNIQNIFKKSTLIAKDIYYRNYYLLDLNNNKIVLSQNKKELEKRRKILRELRYYSQNLKKDYVKKNDMNFNGVDYQNFFVKIEYKATYPKRTFIIQFLPLLNGMSLIHEYIELAFEEEQINKKYKEKSIIYGYDSNDNIFRNISNSFFENEHNILKQIHSFIVESLFCSNPSIKFFFYLDKKQKIYFSEEILEIINEELYEYFHKNKKFYSYLTSSNHNFYSKKIINQILNVLFEEYIQINNKEKIIHKSSSALPICSANSYLSFKSLLSGFSSSSLKLTKNDALLYLFNSIKLNKNINPNDITIDLNDENSQKNEKNNISRITDLIDKDDKFSIRFSDLLSEKNIESKNIKIKKKYFIAPFPKDSEEGFQENGGNFIFNKINNGVKNNNFKINIFNNKMNKNNKNKIEKIYSGEHSIQRCLIDEIIRNEAKDKSNKKLNKNEFD